MMIQIQNGWYMQNKIQIIDGNLFTSKAQTLVNTINTVGVMGAGIALEFRLRYPDMYKKYKELCKQKLIQIGKLWLYQADDRYILNFPTKENWKDDSKIEYLEKGLEKFVLTYKEKGIKSVAFPLLGSDKGNIPQNESLNLMLKYLKLCDIPVEIYRYDPDSYDDLYPKLKNKLKDLSFEHFIKISKIQKKYAKIIFDALNEDKIKSISGLKELNGIGISTLEKLFDFLFDRIKLDNNEELKFQLLGFAKIKLKKNTFTALQKYLSKKKNISKTELSILKLIIENKD